MEVEISPNGSNGGIRLSSWASNKAGNDRRLAPTQPFNDLADMRIALSRDARAEGVAVLNQILVDTMTLRDLYKKHHWQTSGPTFYELHLLFDRHYDEQAELIDAIAERVQILGGISIAMAADVAEMTTLERPSRDREAPSVQLARLIDAHERVLYGARTAARRATEVGDDGTNDLLVSDVIRTNEKQAWFVQEQAQRNCVPR
jgi:starvation-inducible DNA-binding protein